MNARKLVLIGVATLLSTIAHAETFETADKAAVQGLTVVMNKTDKTCLEYAGAIVRHADGSFSYTDPVTGKRDQFQFTLHLNAGESLAGLYHTHPACDNSDVGMHFSPADVKQAQALKVVSYIGVLYDKTVRSFNPATDHTERKDHDLSGGRITYGQQIAKLDVLTASN